MFPSFLLNWLQVAIVPYFKASKMILINLEEIEICHLNAEVTYINIWVSFSFSYNRPR